MNQIDYENDKYQLLNKIFKQKKYIINQSYIVNGNTFYIDFSIGEKYFGIIHDYNYHGNCYKISFYKDIKDTYLYKFSDYFYRFFNIYHKWFFIEDYQYE